MLRVGEGSEGEYTWGIYEFPIDYTEVSLKIFFYEYFIVAFNIFEPSL